MRLNSKSADAACDSIVATRTKQLQVDITSYGVRITRRIQNRAEGGFRVNPV